LIARQYFVRQAATLLKFAQATSDPQVVAALVKKAADLKSRIDEASPLSHSRCCARNLAGMDKQTPPKPISPRCPKCGEQPTFTVSMLDPPTGRRFLMFECECGNRTWVAARL
jgi:hypothetical protein